MLTAGWAVRESWSKLLAELIPTPEIEKYVYGYGFSFSKGKRESLRQLQVNIHAYIIEARSCFYNLADFYRYFASNYLELSVSKGKSYDFLATLATGNWAGTLKRIRDHIAHEDAPSLEFELVSDVPRGYELLIDFNAAVRDANGEIRKIAFDDPDVVTLSELEDVVNGLQTAQEHLRVHLVSAIHETK